MAIKSVKKNSRRSPLAAAAVILAGLLVSGGGYAAATAAVATETAPAYSAAQVDAGKKLFLSNCASCHGKNAEGTKNAPSLIGVGAASVDFQVATGRMPMADMSQQAMRKEPVYTPEQVNALAMYVASLAPGPEVPTDEMLNYERDGSVAEGG